MAQKKVDVLVLGNIYRSSGGRGIDECLKKGTEQTVTQKFYMDHQTQLKILEKKKGEEIPENDSESETEGGEG